MPNENKLTKRLHQIFGEKKTQYNELCKKLYFEGQSFWTRNTTNVPILYKIVMWWEGEPRCRQDAVTRSLL